LSKHSNPRFHDRWWAKMIQLSKTTLSTSRCDLSPNFLLKEIWHVEKNNNSNFVYISMHEKIYMSF
jgi:hypothetical protein